MLRVIGSMDPSSGGPCQGIRNSIPALKELGVYNEVVCMDDPNATFLGTDPFTINALGPANNPWAYSTKLKYWLIKNINRFDAVIVHGLWLYPGYAIYQAFKSVKGNLPKLFVMPHGMLDPYFQRAETRKLKAFRNWFYWKLVESKIIHRADCLLFTCKQEMILARETFRPYIPKKELNIGYGIPEPPSYYPGMTAKFLELCPKVKGKSYLLFLSRIHEKKGVDLLIKAYLQLKEQHPKELPVLVIAGPGLDTTYGEQLQQLVDQSPMLNGSIFFTGMLTGASKWWAFYGCEAFVLPSHQENFGIAVVEALSCGKPVLISDQVNIWREIASAGAGIVANDTEAGCLKMLETWLDLTDREREGMKHNAKDCFEEHFSIGPNALRLKKAIEGKLE